MSFYCFKRKSKVPNETSKFHTNHTKINQNLFIEYLSEFEFSELHTSLRFVEMHSTAENLDEYNKLINLSPRVDSQWQATMFAKYLENYAKSFRFDYSEKSVYDYISNKIDRPIKLEEKKTKKADWLIQKNNINNYEDLIKKEKAWLLEKQSNFSKINNNEILLKDVFEALNFCKTHDIKLEVLKIYLSIQLKYFISLDNNSKKTLFSTKYYQTSMFIIIKKIKTLICYFNRLNIFV